MTDYIPAPLRQLVQQRALGACEYCLIHQTFSMYRHEVDHAIALKYGGQTTPENLVLACLPCNRLKPMNCWPQKLVSADHSGQTDDQSGVSRIAKCVETLGSVPLCPKI